MKLLKITISVIILFISNIIIYAQGNYEKAEDAFKKTDYINSLKFYKNAFLESSDNRTRQIEITFKIAENYRILEITVDAETWYKRAILLEYPDPIVYLHYAEMKRLNKKYDEAVNEYQNYISIVPNDDKAKLELDKCKIEAIKSDKLAHSNSNIIASKQKSNDSNIKNNIADNTSYSSQTKYKNPEEVELERKIDSTLNKINNLKTSGNKKELAKSYNDVATLHYNNGDNANAIEYFTLSLQNKEELGDKQGVSTELQNMGVAFHSAYRYDEAIKNYEKSLQIKHEISDQAGESKLLFRIGSVYYEKKDYAKAVEYFEKKLVTDKSINNEKDIAATNNNLGVMLYEMKNFEKSIEYFENALSVNTKSGNEKEMSITLNNLGNIKFDMQKSTDAIDLYNRSLKIKEKIDYKRGIAITLYNIGNVYSNKNLPDKALEFYTKCEKISREQNFFDIMYCNYIALSDIYTIKKNCELAFENFKSAEPYKLFAAYIGNRKQLSELQNNYDFESLKNPGEISLLTEEITRQKLLVKEMNERREMEMELKNLELENKESELSVQKTQKYASFIGLLFLVVIAFLLFRGYKIKKKQNEIINEKNEELKQQKEEIIVQRDLVTEQKEKIEEIHTELTDSIYYAKRIQKAVLPSEEHISGLLIESNIKPNDLFILFKPRDIVSGDFYFVEKRNKSLLLAVADCTGHGVPGAFMSMLGVAFLNEIISKENINTPAEALNELREYIVHSLQQRGISGEQKDGMDITFVAYDYESKKIQYSGANNSLYLIRNLKNYKKEDFDNQTFNFSILESLNTVLIEIKPDKMPVAIYENMNKFANHTIQLLKGDIIYLSSDGYSDQFGGSKGKKYMSKNLKMQLNDISSKPVSEQSNILNKTIEDWKNYHSKLYEQTDDITIMGIKIS